MYSPSEEDKMEGEGTESKGNLEGCLSRGFPDDKVPDHDIFHRFMRATPYISRILEGNSRYLLVREILLLSRAGKYSL